METNAGQAPPMVYLQAELDGLRAIAVIAVLANHANSAWLTGVSWSRQLFRAVWIRSCTILDFPSK